MERLRLALAALFEAAAIMLFGHTLDEFEVVRGAEDLCREAAEAQP